MSMAAFVTIALGFAGQLANSQGLVTNCTWQTGLLVDSFLGMYCNNNDWADYSYDWTWLDTNACLANSGGDLYPYGSGNYWSTCDNCSIHKSNVTFLLTCDCLNANSQFSPATYDLNLLIWNHDGILGCFDHIGNKTEKGPF
ncbi:hypothetical protein F4806DRAFT_452244 [Annulohypoxylon nitens]|nr:hypothetical protein F4806DRAFT_452244 [Annulohypoxylon nitens]KAI1444022.1 hypothetical protein F5Y02DRAFT_419538 [Annulohypoxylon stygium]